MGALIAFDMPNAVLFVSFTSDSLPGIFPWIFRGSQEEDVFTYDVKASVVGIGSINGRWCQIFIINSFAEVDPILRLESLGPHHWPEGVRLLEEPELGTVLIGPLPGILVNIMSGVLKSHPIIISHKNVLLQSVDSKVMEKVSLEALKGDSIALVFSITILNTRGENIGNPEH